MLKTFKIGGIHPSENKLSADKKIEILPLPAKVAIPVSQHIGAPAKVKVRRNEKVKVGQLIAESGGFISANIHSPVSGKVLKIDNVYDTSGYKRQAVIIKTEGDIWEESIDRRPDIVKEIKAEAEEIINKVKSAGVVGLGGATFPSHVKLMPPKGFEAKTLIINGVECEPYLTADHRLMLEKGEELIIGVKILMKALRVDKAYIGIENNKPDAILNIKKITQNYPNIWVIPLKVQYPQGGEKQLIDAVIKRQVPSGALPIAVGTVVHNVGTALAVYEAVQKNKPLIERVVTITGKSVKNPGNYIVRLGTPINELIDAAGGLPEDTGKVISGGPMMGKALNSLDISIAKGTSGILIMQKGESMRRAMQPCIRCAKCISICPMGLEPYLLMTLAQKQMFENEEKECIMDCIECGSCSWICPADRPLLDYIRLGKRETSAIMRARNN